MAIKELADLDGTYQPVPPDQIDQTVMTIMSTLGTTAKDFDLASRMYNYDFFRDESQEFKQSMCNALRAHFSSYPNSFWNKFSTTDWAAPVPTEVKPVEPQTPTTL